MSRQFLTEIFSRLLRAIFERTRSITSRARPWSQVFRWGSVLFFGGIFFGSFFHFSAGVLYIAVLCAALVAYGCRFYPRYFFYAVFGTAFLLGFFRIAAFDEAQSGSTTKIPGQRFEGIISAEVRKNLLVQKFIVSTARGEVIQIHAPVTPEYSYGDSVEVFCGAVFPPGGISHGIANAARIDGVCVRPAITLHQEGARKSFLRTLFLFKSFFHSSLAAYLPPTLAGFISGLLAGGSSGIPQGVIDDFRTAGLSHILAISGFNVSIIIALFSLCAEKLPLSRRVRCGVLLASIVVFIVFTGSSAAAIRAGLMGGFALCAPLFGRSSKSLNSLFLSAVAMVAINPSLLVGDIGFQLSFLATLGIVELSPLLAFPPVSFPGIHFIGEVVSQTIAALLMSAPVILLNFGTFSVVALAANSVITPFIPLVMGMGFIVGSAASIEQAFSLHAVKGLIQFFSWPLWLAGTAILKIAHFLAHFPGASIAFPKGAGTVAAVFLWYGTLALCAFIVKNKAGKADLTARP